MEMTGSTSALARADSEHHIHAFADLSTLKKKGAHIFCKGKGVKVWDSIGNEYLDAISGMWCVGLGYGDTVLADIAQSQLASFSYCPVFNDKTSDVAVLLCEKIANLRKDGLRKVMFVNSGSEANDTALKMVWYFNNARGLQGKKAIVTFDRAYHGSTIAAASLTALPHMHASFDLPIFPVIRVPSPDIRKIENGRNMNSDEIVEALTAPVIAEIEQYGPDRVGAFFAEPVLGAGGVIIPPQKFYAKLQEYLRKNDILLVLDEVITGFGRTGELFGADAFEISPDITTMAKNLTSGYLPMGAVMLSDEIYEVIEKESERIGTFATGMTYSGHPVSSAVALECLSRYGSPQFLGNVRALGTVLEDALSAHSRNNVTNLRRIGLLAAVDIVTQGLGHDEERDMKFAATVVRIALKYGVILRAVGNTIVFCPPFISSPEEIRNMVYRFGEAVDEAFRETIVWC
ncbi:aspartate aminotransferase family protein [Burkholderia sp. LMG 21824]|uniref:aminotransferase family protein n=1 Tax=Burkholderia sp. LMG 21824 TaxID=3158172 RepID=UPI003C2C0A75